jgi:hypothetical protein
MKTTLGPIVSAVRLGLLAVVMTACSTSSSYLSPTGSNTTLMAGWEQHFALEWATTPAQGSAQQVTGYVYNLHGEHAMKVRVLAQALDQQGAVVGQRIEWVPGGVNGFGRTYFVVAQLPSATAYRVTIWDYTWHQTDGGDHR